MKEETIAIKDLDKFSLEEIKEYKTKINKAYNFYSFILEKDNIMLEILEYEKNNVEKHI
jgi:hypothetical protein